MAAPVADAGRSRLERKFQLGAEWGAALEQMLRLHPAGFHELHPPRFVNNCYFDSPRLVSYRDAVEGHSRRAKVRIRWYGELFGAIAEPVLEVKEKRGLVGSKAKYPLRPFVLDRTTRLGSLGEWPAADSLPGTVLARFGALRPILLNRYARRYLISADRRFRLTLDSGLEYYRVAAPRLPTAAAPGLPLILELKYDTAADDVVSFITTRFPVRLGKSSKYAMGLRRLGHR